nr:uncharacterized protein LOC109163333 [Ipomoea batatas]GMD23937.1 uncharacterized protein LOC109163333 [Ipomoea batatas]GME11436.1 uncharacterized protein LOC109163333 [Ipomoea batatas]GME17069.1 uncharacterized protein LOC109163333 [Ipomoea batatas]
MASNSSEETLPKIAKANALVASFKPVAYKGSGFVDDHLCKSFSQLVSGDEAQVTSSGVEPGLSSGHMDYGFNEDRDSIGEVSLVLVE